MSILLIPISPPSEELEETINISNGEWRAIIAVADAFGINTSIPVTHDPVTYSPEVLRETARRIEQLKDAPKWLRWLADSGGANLS